MRLDGPATVSLGFVNVHLIPAGSGCALVDTGVPGSEGKIFADMARYGLPPEALSLIFVTHAHGDHMGGLSAVAGRSGAAVVAHRSEAPALASGISLQPRGLTLAGKIAALFMGRFTRAASGYPWQPDVIVEGELPLAEFGVQGRAIATPGHTMGSLTLLLDSGEAFVGDLCARIPLPLVGSRSGVPFFGDDRATIYDSWRRLLDAGATQIYPGHGAPFPAAVLRDELVRAGQWTR